MFISLVRTYYGTLSINGNACSLSPVAEGGLSLCSGLLTALPYLKSMLFDISVQQTVPWVLDYIPRIAAEISLVLSFEDVDFFKNCKR